MGPPVSTVYYTTQLYSDLCYEAYAEHSASCRKMAVLKLKLFIHLFVYIFLCRKGVLQHLNSKQHGGVILEKDDAQVLLLWASQ